MGALFRAVQGRCAGGLTRCNVLARSHKACLGTSTARLISSEFESPAQRVGNRRPLARAEMGMRVHRIAPADVAAVLRRPATGFIPCLKPPRKRALPQARPIVSIGGGVRRLGDPRRLQDVYDYELEVFDYMKRNEVMYLPGDVFRYQTIVTPSMRSSVVDWIVDLHLQLKFHTDSLYLTVRLIDIYLSRVDVSRQEVQQVAAVALLLAGKYQESALPTLSDLCDACQGVEAARLRGLEAEFLHLLGWRLDVVLPPQFLKRFLRVVRAGAERKFSMLSHYVLELTLLDAQYANEIPSHQAVAAVAVALAIQGKGWDPVLEHQTRFARSEIESLAARMLETMRQFGTAGCRWGNIRRKYSSSEAGRVASLHVPSTLLL